MDIAGQIAELHRHLEILAEEGKWLEILAEEGKWLELADAIRRRDELLAKVSVEDRADILGVAVCSTERLLQLARADRQAVSEKLSLLRRGRDLAGRYASNQSDEKFDDASSRNR